MKLIAPIAVIIAAAAAGRVYDNKLQANYANSVENYQSDVENQNRRQFLVQSDAYDKQYLQNVHREESNGEKHANILGYHSENDGHTYKYGYETDNGIKAEEIGDTTGKGTSAQGAYSYKGDDGKVYTVTYVADEHGFRPSGEHLPTPPPVPEEILKSLEFNAKAEANGVFDDGNYREHNEGQQHHHYEAAQQYEGGQHFESGQQSVGYSSSGADLAYHAQAPGFHTVSQASSEHGSEYGHQGSTGYAQQNLVYVAPSGYTAGHNAGGHAVTDFSQHASLGYEAHSSFLPSTEHSGHTYSGNAGHVGGRSYLPPSSHSGYHK